MKSKVKEVLDTLSTNYGRTSLSLPQLDAEKIKVKLALEEEGIKRGCLNQPPSTATVLDDLEQRIVSLIQDEVKAATESYYDHTRAFEERIARLQAAGYAGSMENIAITAEGDFEALVRKDASQLYTAQRNVKESEEDLANFKVAHGLKRAARFPKSRFLYFAVAILVVAVETAINGMFFAEGHELGLLGGGFTALIPSLINVFLGYYLGNFAIRLAVHTNKQKSFFGKLLIVAIPLLMLVINLMVAHYRSAMTNAAETGSVEAAKVALLNFQTHLLQLQDIESWLLFGTGCIFCMISTIDFWKMDDPYPGYGEITRQYQDKLRTYADIKADAVDELAELRDDRLDALEQASNLANAKLTEGNAIVDSQQRWKVVFAEHMTHLENVGKELIGYYRTMNMSHRTTETPSYFTKDWKLTRVKLPEPGIDFLKALQDFKDEIKEMRTAYSSCSNKIGSAFRSALESYQTIGQLSPMSETHG